MAATVNQNEEKYRKLIVRMENMPVILILGFKTRLHQSNRKFVFIVGIQHNKCGKEMTKRRVNAALMILQRTVSRAGNFKKRY